MKKKNLLAIFCALAMSVAIGTMAACAPSDEPGGENPGGENPGGENPGGETTVYGLPVAERGHYINNSDLFEDDGTR